MRVQSVKSIKNNFSTEKYSQKRRHVPPALLQSKQMSLTMVENPLSDTKSNRGIVAKNFSTQSRSQAARPFEGTSTSTKNHVLAIMAQRERGIMSNQHTTNDDGTTFITGTNIHSRGARQGAGRHSRFTTTPANN